MLGGGYLATQGQTGPRVSDETSARTPAPPVEKPATPPANAAGAVAPNGAQASAAPGGPAAAGGGRPPGGGAPGGGAAAGGGGGGGGAAPPPPTAVLPPPPPPVAYLPPPPVYPTAGAPPGAPGAPPGALAGAPAAPVAPPVPPGTPMVLKEVTIEAATVIEVQLAAEVSTDSAKPEDKMIARVLKPIVADGVEAIPKDTPVTGTVMLVDKAGAIRGRPRIEWQFESMVVANQRYNIVAPRLFYEGESPTGAAAGKVERERGGRCARRHFARRQEGRNPGRGRRRRGRRDRRDGVAAQGRGAAGRRHVRLPAERAAEAEHPRPAAMSRSSDR